MIETSQLRCFVILAQELHFGHAAARLNMTQPPLSRQIQMLEHEVGARLFERTSRSVSLTPTGQTFLPEARRILELTEKALQTARRTARGEIGSITLGFTAASGAGVLPTLLIACRKELPSVDFGLNEMVTSEQTDALENGRIDIALMRPPIDERFDSFLLTRERLLAAFSSTNPLAKGPAPTLADFHRRPFVMYSPYKARYFYELLVSLFREAEVVPDYVQHVSQIHTILSLVRAGLGAAIVPQSATNLGDGISYRAIPGIPNRAADLMLCWHRDNTNPIIQPVVRVAKTLISI